MNPEIVPPVLILQWGLPPRLRPSWRKPPKQKSLAPKMISFVSAFRVVRGQQNPPQQAVRPLQMELLICFM